MQIKSLSQNNSKLVYFQNSKNLDHVFKYYFETLGTKYPYNHHLL